MLWKATAYLISTGDPTGQVEYYQGSTREIAAKRLFYTHQFHSPRWVMGPSGFTISLPNGDLCWVVAPRPEPSLVTA